ncbi:MAG: hypothetical protein LC114_21095 [Bryobacterales bacterium]|nr:hypothetical protein [Bryobacterales bacterium]
MSIDVQEPGEYTLFQIKDIANTPYLPTHRQPDRRQPDRPRRGSEDLAAYFTNTRSTRHASPRCIRPNTVVDYHATMGVTPAYNLGDFERGSIYFTGQTAEQALNLDGQSGYDVLRVQAEVEQGPGVSERTMQCRVQGKLTDAAGFVVDAVTGEAEVREGTNWVAMDFRGPRIARSNVNGRSPVRDVSNRLHGDPGFQRGAVDDGELSGRGLRECAAGVRDRFIRNQHQTGGDAPRGLDHSGSWRL